MDPLTYLQRHVYRELVRFAAGQNITCPVCGDILDAKATVVITDTDDHTQVRCAACYGRPAGTFQNASVTVLDGRTLFDRPSKKTWRYAQ